MREIEKRTKNIIFILAFFGIVFLAALSAATYIQEISLVLSARPTNEYIEYKHTGGMGVISVCSALCLDSPINLKPHLEEAFKTRKLHVFYEPYFKDLKTYDYNLVEHKQCCVVIN
jgi:hypothetical protein